jgi:iron(II)-dependent oxidoreductase
MAAHRTAVRQLPLFALLVPGVTMQTTGLASGAIGGLYEGAGLAAELAEARSRTLAIYAHLDLETIEFPCIPLVNPALWELAHVAWFQEYWCLRGGDERAATLLERSDALFNSSLVAHDTRWHLDYPAPCTLLRYLDESLDATLEALARTPEDRRYFFHLALLHEDMHGEALLMTLQTLALAAPAIDLRAPPSFPAGPACDIRFEGGAFIQGSEDGAGFVFDNERGAHRVELAPFAIASRPVTQGEFAAYLEATGAAAPAHWKRGESDWIARRFDRWAPIDRHAPMVHVSLAEGGAYCRWAGRRLPTESEWEFAARNGGTEGRERHATMIGGVWEWTATPFAPYPGFEPGPYRDYSQPWFHTHQVLRGGSFATRPRIATNRYRNFYMPGRSDMFAGFRTCAV